MKILLVHNKYGAHSGEESIVYAQRDLLVSHGHEVMEYYRSSEEIGRFGGQVNAFLSGFYNRRSAKEIKRRMADGGQPDIVHIHNLYPLISPAILSIIKSPHHHTTTPPHHHITTPPKVVMTVHNYRLVCPNGLFFSHGEICEECAGGHEARCVVKNCEGSILKSTGYALRNGWARKNRLYLDHVDLFLCLTEFQKGKLIANGYPAEKCRVLPNFLDPGDEAPVPGDSSQVLFAGRLNRQKGFDLLVSAAGKVPDIRFKAAGSPDPSFMKSLGVPENLELTGHLPPAHLQDAFVHARFLVFTSRSYEGFPVVFLEAMRHRIPVIAPDMAGFPEIIGDGVNGLLFAPGNADDLAARIRMLWDDRDLCARLGENGHRKLREQYSSDIYCKNLIHAYESIP